MKPETDRRKVVSRLTADGWQLVRQNGPHDVYWHPQRNAQIAVPRHRTLSPGVARKIANAAGWN